MTEPREFATRPRKILGQRTFAVVVACLHSVGAIAAAFLTTAFIAYGLLKILNTDNGVFRVVFFGLILLLAILFSFIYTFVIGRIFDLAGRRISQRYAVRRRQR
ncbi:MAG TPA: hypothetical protein IGS53_25500 [Leptolyngbyaceae cyanobacterium M33_DOE_097]|uniref:Uncharacterized protein n=1 Tax=Oscillatoriales cyanobacterium SpSt-418 TaxID=2282169 RepID=A0A7C3PJ00_9CYAN|nr:hypothetical protein [Leptolyngbyaceae cyanobacterium M33_DOE_097]